MTMIPYFTKDIVIGEVLSASHKEYFSYVGREIRSIKADFYSLYELDNNVLRLYLNLNNDNFIDFKESTNKEKTR